MTMKKTIFMIALIYILPTTPTSVACDDGTTTLKVLVASGAAATAAYGLYKFCSWLLDPSDEKLLERSYSDYQHAYSHYSPLWTQLRATHSTSNNHTIIHNFSEQLLYQLAYEICYEKRYEAPFNEFMYALDRTVSRLDGHKKKITRRIDKLYTSRHSDENKVYLYDQLIASLDKINSIFPHLKLVHDYFRHHRSYFNLFDLETRLLATYDSELNALKIYSQGHPLLKEALARSVMTHHTTSRRNFPYLIYADKITTDINTLYSAIQRLSYNYSERIHHAQDLYNNLCIIKGIILTSVEYQRDLQEKQQLERKEQELAIQQQQAHAMQQQAHTMQQQAQAMQEHNYLQQQELYVQPYQTQQPRPTQYTYQTDIYL